jgi:hypothetical protein
MHVHSPASCPRLFRDQVTQGQRRRTEQGHFRLQLISERTGQGFVRRAITPSPIGEECLAQRGCSLSHK